jgi:hypothetical protein
LKIKFNNIRDLGDARYAAANMATWMGFGAGAQKSLSPAKIQEIAAWCAGPELVLELAEGMPEAQILSLLHVIPCGILEVWEKDYFRLVDHPELKELQWMVRTNSEISFPVKGWRHKPLKRISGAEANAIYCLDGQKLEDIREHAPELGAISLSCFEAAAGFEKDYGPWNEIFELFEE